MSINTLIDNKHILNQIVSGKTLHRETATKTTDPVLHYATEVSNTFVDELSYTSNATVGDIMVINKKGLWSITAQTFMPEADLLKGVWLDLNGTNSTVGSYLGIQTHCSNSSYQTVSYTGVIDAGSNVRVKSNVANNITPTDTNLYVSLVLPM